MKLSWILLTGFLLFPTFALAQTSVDTFGIYADLAGPETLVTTAAPFEQITAYLCVKDPSSRAISGWECKVDILSPTASAVVAPSWSYAGGGMNMGDPAVGTFNVGVGPGDNALPPVAGLVVLATYSAFIMTPADQFNFYILPYPGSVTFPDSPTYPGGTPGYVDGDDVGIIKYCGVSSGTPTGNGIAWGTMPVFAINTAGVIPNTETDWGHIKSLYR